MRENPGIVPVKRVNVGEQVYEQLKQLLIQGKWKPGDKLPSENELARMFGVSRMTLRQALKKLSALGLLETKSGEGTFVKSPEIGNIMDGLIPVMYMASKTEREVLEFREILESEGVRLATQRASGKELDELERIIERMVDAASRDQKQEFADADLEFHFQCGKITQNPLIIRTNEILRDVLQTAMNDLIESRGFETGIRYHTKILNAMRAGEAGEAMYWMRVHIWNTEEGMKTWACEKGGYIDERKVN